MLSTIAIAISATIILIASITDLKTYEVPDTLTYLGVALGWLIATISSIQQWSATPAISSAIGTLIGFAIGAAMFYTGQWGGGDAKLMIALGSLLGFSPHLDNTFVAFTTNLIFAGGLWGLAWSLGLFAVNRKRAWRAFKALMHQKAYVRVRTATLASTTLLLILALLMKEFQLELFALAMLCYALSHLALAAKSIELVAMHKWISPEKLTEGDWLVHSVKVGKVRIDPRKTGLEMEDVKKLKELHRKGKLDKVCVKFGVPFVPSFLIAFAFTIAFGNVLLLIL